MRVRLRPMLLIPLAVLIACDGDTDSPADDDDSTADDDDTTAGDDDDSTAGDDDDTSEADDDDSGDDDSAPTTFQIDPADPRLRYVGRWDVSVPSQPTVGWAGASVALRFEGTDLDVTLDAGWLAEPYRVVVDGDHLGSRRFTSSPGPQTYVLAQGLAPGEHEIELVKESYEGGDMVLLGFEGRGPGPLAAPATAQRHIEFYGDSNLAGVSLMSERNESGADLQGCHFTFAGVAARALGADYHNISVSGETLRGMRDLYDRQSWYDGVPSWDFADYPADVVLMNLGANDIYGANEAAIRQRYSDMLDLLRAAHPAAPIVVFNGYGWDHDEPADYTASVVDVYGDPNVTAATFPWLFEQWHGCEYDHGGMAHYLIEHLEAVTGWTAAEPALMSGFGRGGDVANGGFEGTAPFGGYGWRYHDDPGVHRVEDASLAHGGDHYVQLADGATIHQPNPASSGDLVEVSMWLRGATSGDEVEVTVDFRDQSMWTTPLQATTEVMALTTSWQPYTVAATAPSPGANPVFHTRLTIEAGAGHTVDVDDVSMTVTP